MTISQNRHWMMKSGRQCFPPPKQSFCTVQPFGNKLTKFSSNSLSAHSKKKDVLSDWAEEKNRPVYTENVAPLCFHFLCYGPLMLSDVFPVLCLKMEYFIKNVSRTRPIPNTPRNIHTTNSTNWKLSSMDFQWLISLFVDNKLCPAVFLSQPEYSLMVINVSVPKSLPS